MKIWVPCVSPEYNTRQYMDMDAEMAQILVNLPPRTAYAKVTQVREEVQTVLKRQIQTFKLSDPVRDKEGIQAIIDRSYSLYPIKIANKSKRNFPKRRKNASPQAWRRPRQTPRRKSPGQSRVLPPTVNRP